MPEFRRDRALPFVYDDQPDVVQVLGGLFAEVVDAELPGLGIVHRGEAISQSDVHKTHFELLIRAGHSLGSAVLLDTEPRNQSAWTTDYGTKLHADVALQEDTYEYLPLLLRLHTAGAENGAVVRFVLTRAGFLPFRGETPRERIETVDDSQCERKQPSSPNHRALMVEAIMQDSFDPLLSEPDIFTFTQHPLSSVVFRTASSLGPVTAHEFTPQKIWTSRKVMTADLALLSH